MPAPDVCGSGQEAEAKHHPPCMKTPNPPRHSFDGPIELLPVLEACPVPSPRALNRRAQAPLRRRVRPRLNESSAYSRLPTRFQEGTSPLQSLRQYSAVSRVPRAGRAKLELRQRRPTSYSNTWDTWACSSGAAERLKRRANEQEEKGANFRHASRVQPQRDCTDGRPLGATVRPLRQSNPYSTSDNLHSSSTRRLQASH
jgi:hypothetical protein